MLYDEELKHHLGFFKNDDRPEMFTIIAMAVMVKRWKQLRRN
jgi:hypothetical protein